MNRIQRSLIWAGAALLHLNAWLIPAYVLAAQDSETVFLDYLFEPASTVKFGLNPNDFSDAWRDRPFPMLKRGDSVWIGTKSGIEEGKFVSVTTKKEKTWPQYSGMLELTLSFNVPIPKGFVLLSLKPLPAQAWRIIPLSTLDLEFIKKTFKTQEKYWPPVKIQSNRLGQFLIAHENTGKEGAFDSYRTVLFRFISGSWQSVNEYTDQAGEPLVDIDGDGFPEIAGSTDYKSWILRRLFPSVEKLTVNNSGV